MIKHGDSFAVFDHAGAIRRAGMGEQGIYHDGTRFLDRFEIAVERRRPLLLGSTVRRDGVLVVDLANPDLPDDPLGPLERDAVHLIVTSFLWDGVWYARLRLHSYARRSVELEVSFLFEADFADIFEVRGVHRLRRGRLLDPVIGSDAVALAYEGLDQVVRTTRLAFAPVPDVLTARRASFRVRLAGRDDAAIEVRAAFESGAAPRPVRPFDDALALLQAARSARVRGCATVDTTHRPLDAWIERSAADLHLMASRTEHGEYPYAGVPWYSTPFGRDGILTAYEALWIDPALARGVLGFLAATQATELDPERDAEPGKVIHELRRGEMAALGEVPFGSYYGSIDATPLFVVLAAAYWRRTADRALIESIWPHVERAVEWIERHGDLDGDGFVEYMRRSTHGLTSQGWKDSGDSISHADGSLAEPPIALCEVQGYAYAARRAAAELARVLGRDERADHLDRDAEALRDRFERAFWCDELGTYALALDGAKRQCRVRASNAGHCLFAGIASPEHARRVVGELLDDASFTGWGIRTLDARVARYSPISYHNGSVWPHDNAVIAAGMARYGHKDACARLLSALLDASGHFDLHRMPELFCGFRQRPDEGPTLYPVACAPQAWSAGAVFLLLQACLGLDIDAVRSRIVFDRPVLPTRVERVVMRNLAIGDARVDVALHNHGCDVGVHLERREGRVEVAIVK